jgi:lipopolysaccharide export system protein LptA
MLGLLPCAAIAANAAPKIGSSSAPIEINADALEVLQEENRAIFTGHVVAIQEKIRLKSEKMTVFYKSPDEKQKKEGQDAIQKIEVEGNVFMTTPDETASGASGVYDVENKRILLNNNVVLTRGKNTLKGDKLVYDLGTGKSSVSSTGAASQEGGKKERVRALFVPDEKKKKP